MTVEERNALLLANEPPNRNGWVDDPREQRLDVNEDGVLVVHWGGRTHVFLGWTELHGTTVARLGAEVL
jgi:hypothetical protein